MPETPPAALPAGFLPVWRALAAADREAPSRQELARRLGVGTHTIQRILVRGDVPAFPETRAPKVVHAWVRTLSRIAGRLGAPARPWVEGVGIEWTPAIAAISAAAAATPSAPKAAPAQQSGRAFRAPETPLRVGIADLPPFSDPLPGGQASWFEHLARRWIGSLLPGAPLEFLRMDEPALAVAVGAWGAPSDDGDDGGAEAAPAPHVDLAVGILGGPSRARSPIRTVRIPGWNVRAAAVGLRPLGEAGRAGWGPLLREAREGAARILVDPCGPLIGHLAGSCGLPPEAIERIPTLADRGGNRVRDLAERLLSALDDDPQDLRASAAAPLYLCADETMCRRVVSRLQAPPDPVDTAAGRARIPKDYEAVIFDGPPFDGPPFDGPPFDGPPAALPAYPLVLAVPAGGRLAARDLRAARDHELFGPGAAHTASLYARLAVWSYMRSERHGSLPRRAGGGLWRPSGLALARPAFRGSYALHLAAHLYEGLRGLRAGGEAPAFERPHELVLSVLEEARQAAGRLVPAAWQEATDAVFRDLRSRTLSHGGTAVEGAAEGNPLPAGVCRSCAAALHDGVHGGPSDRYCRFCAGPSGRLRPREEVAQVLARWIGSCAGGMDPETALRRAERFMARMPAWSGN